MPWAFIAWFLINLALLLAYAFLWRRRKDLAAQVYVHKGAIWLVWVTAWFFLLGRLAFGPLAPGLAKAARSPFGLVEAVLSLLALLLGIYLTYLFIFYPLFSSLRPSFSREHFGLDWQLDVYIEDKVSSLVEDSPTTPWLVLNMGLAEFLQDTPAESWLNIVQNLWVNYLPVVTNHRAAGVAFLPDGHPDYVEPDLNRTIRLCLEGLTVTDNRSEESRRHNVAAFPLLAGGQPALIFAVFWPARKPFASIFNLAAQQFGIIRSQYMLAAEVSADRLAHYDSPWNDIEGNGDGQ